MKKICLSRPGILSCAGKSSNEFWENLIQGNQSGIKKIKAVNGKDFFAGVIEESFFADVANKNQTKIIKIIETALLSIQDDIKTVLKKYSPDKIGICVGTCDNGSELSLQAHREYFKNGKFPSDYSLKKQSAGDISSYIAKKYKISGPVFSCATACSSSAGAIIKGAQLIQAGICNAVIAGGADLIGSAALLGFDSLEAVSQSITNPFSKNRNGITLGEAAAFFVMTKDDIYENKPSVFLLGYGESSDAYHATSPDPSGKGAAKAMNAALSSSKLNPDKIDYLNLHGTGTVFNDSMESLAVNEVFGNYKVPASTTKHLTGHTLGAAGALEAAICWHTLVENYNICSENINLPLQKWDFQQDENLPQLNIIDEKNKFKVQQVRICMSNSFGFGGANSCLVLGI